MSSLILKEKFIFTYMCINHKAKAEKTHEEQKNAIQLHSFQTASVIERVFDHFLIQQIGTGNAGLPWFHPNSLQKLKIWLWLLASRPTNLAAGCGVAHWLSSSLAIRQPLHWFLGSPALLTGKQIDCSIFARKTAGPTCFVPALDETKY